ncbi:MAG TPA: HEAT repeat domain-containing protein, partial [Pyrinomonadaceae bacterium]
MQRIAQLLENLKDTSKPDAVWKDAAKRLRQIGGAEVITALVETLTDDDKFVRARAAKALGSIRSNLAAVQLAEALKDPDAVVRANASQALKHISNQEIL